MPTPPILPAKDGYYHPANEGDVVALVRFAAANGLQVRARGASHSVGWSIFTDPVNNVPANQTLEIEPPAGANINIAFDRMQALHWIDEANGIVEVEAGCHLGHDVNDPFGVSTLENSFLHQIFEKGWAVDALGGITHQTVSGFSATGSAGGSTRHSFASNLLAFRVVDGLGFASWIARGDAAFGAMTTSLGLLGIVTSIRLQLVPMYNISGSEATTPVSGPDCPIDFLSSGEGDRPTLEAYLAAQEYTRITWWPQRNIERIQIWKAERVPASNDGLVPYQEFADTFMGWSEQLGGSAIFVLVGNRDLIGIGILLKAKVSRYLVLLDRMGDRRGSGAFKRLMVKLAGMAVGAVVLLVGLLLALAVGSARKLFPMLLPMFQPVTKAAQSPTFHDWYWRSLCMDNMADDVLMSTEFNEMWVPIQYASTVVSLLEDMFRRDGYAATGWFELEIYPGPPSEGWLNPGYTDGTDAYKGGTARFDVYWFRNNEGMPNTEHGFFDQYWKLLRDNEIPFRLHWGKYVPASCLPDWAAYYRKNLPKFDEFMALRARRDPHNLFFTRYWQSRLLGESKGRSKPQGIA